MSRAICFSLSVIALVSAPLVGLAAEEREKINSNPDAYGFEPSVIYSSSYHGVPFELSIQGGHANHEISVTVKRRWGPEFFDLWNYGIEIHNRESYEELYNEYHNLSNKDLRWIKKESEKVTPPSLALSNVEDLKDHEVVCAREGLAGMHGFFSQPEAADFISALNIQEIKMEFITMTDLTPGIDFSFEKGVFTGKLAYDGEIQGCHPIKRTDVRNKLLHLLSQSASEEAVALFASETLDTFFGMDSNRTHGEILQSGFSDKFQRWQSGLSLRQAKAEDKTSYLTQVENDPKNQSPVTVLSRDYFGIPFVVSLDGFRSNDVYKVTLVDEYKVLNQVVYHNDKLLDEPMQRIELEALTAKVKRGEVAGINAVKAERLSSGRINLIQGAEDLTLKEAQCIREEIFEIHGILTSPGFDDMAQVLGIKRVKLNYHRAYNYPYPSKYIQSEVLYSKSFENELIIGLIMAHPFDGSCTVESRGSIKKLLEASLKKNEGAEAAALLAAQTLENVYNPSNNRESLNLAFTPEIQALQADLPISRAKGVIPEAPTSVGGEREIVQRRPVSIDQFYGAGE